MAKISILEKQNQPFFRKRLIALNIFLQKILQHNELKNNDFVKHFYTLSQEELQKCMQYNLPQENYGMIVNLASSVKKGISYLTSYIPFGGGGSQQQVIREYNKDDENFDKYQQLFELSEKKLKIIVESLTTIFENKKKQAEAFAEMSKIFNDLSQNQNLEQSQQILTQVHTQTLQVSEKQKEKSDQLIDSIATILDQHWKHIQNCLQILKDRVNFQKTLLENKQYIQSLGEKAKEDDKIKVQLEEEHLSLMVGNLNKDLPIFKESINNQVNETLKNFIEIESQLAQELKEIWSQN